MFSVSRGSRCFGCGPSMKRLRFRQYPFPFRRTPLPKSWMIWAPLRLPMLSRHMLDTRHEFQPSKNFLAPINMLSVVFGSFIWSNRDCVVTSFSTGILVAFSSTSLINVDLFPMFMMPKYFSEVPAFSPISPSVFLRFMSRSFFIVDLRDMWNILFRMPS